MVMHLFDKFNENETLCNTKSKSKKMEQKRKVKQPAKHEIIY